MNSNVGILQWGKKDINKIVMTKNLLDNQYFRGKDKIHIINK